jgi:cysteine desulfurase
VRQPIAAIAAIVRAADGILLIDAAQMPAHADDAVLRHGDLVAVSAHKRGGPPGIGALLVRDFGALLPMGGQEKGYRPGPRICPVRSAMRRRWQCRRIWRGWRRCAQGWRRRCLRRAVKLCGAGTPRTPLIGAYRMPGVSSAAQLIRFDMAGISVSAGSACSSGSMRPSHVLGAMGWQEPALREVVRVSFGRGTTEAEVDGFTTLWRQIAIEARTRAA